MPQNDLLGVCVQCHGVWLQETLSEGKCWLCRRDAINHDAHTATAHPSPAAMGGEQLSLNFARTPHAPMILT